MRSSGRAENGILLMSQIERMTQIRATLAAVHRSRYNLLVESGFQCAGCGEWNVTTVDESGGRRQRYVEDCQVCCKPNVLQLEYDPEEQQFWISAQLE
jgi:cysteine-rich CPXCG protein